MAAHLERTFKPQCRICGGEDGALVSPCGCDDGVHVACLVRIAESKGAFETCWRCATPFRTAGAVEALALAYANSFEGANGPDTLARHSVSVSGSVTPA